ncbi:hypothetical protein TRFO_35248 [Tritrichomonas foetus]|uniref:Uncharacterized protein n=1 Tax=Tritrichomonas foetus TaxID=1144522 RepID=A0A1J4JHW3_9EUKA|nr:hypothetical protein TRFO_35248 [Tritrichomonas foetus]|eukprot:OHS98313.1 hypothetical protein TRFO_35248 [Tritrichomonas foetus]
MRSIIPMLWLLLHFISFIICFLSVIMFFDKKAHTTLCNYALVVSSFLHFMVTFFDLRVTANIGQQVFDRLLRNYSFHIGSTSFVFLMTQIHPFLWFVSIGFSSFYQVIRYLVIQILPRIRSENRMTSILVSIYRQLSVPPTAELYLSIFELFTSISLFFSKEKRNPIFSDFVKAFYIVWFVMFRYATNKSHQMIWNSISLNFVAIAGTLPNFLGNLIVGSIAGVSCFGNAGLRLYSQVNQTPNPTQNQMEMNDNIMA